MLRLGGPEHTTTPGLVVVFVQGASHHDAVAVARGRVLATWPLAALRRSARSDGVVIENLGKSAFRPR